MMKKMHDVNARPLVTNCRGYIKRSGKGGLLDLRRGIIDKLFWDLRQEASPGARSWKKIEVEQHGFGVFKMELGAVVNKGLRHVCR